MYCTTIAVALMDYVVTIGHIILLQFDECESRHCVNVTINNDMTLELMERYLMSLLSGQLTLLP